MLNASSVPVTWRECNFITWNWIEFTCSEAVKPLRLINITKYYEEYVTTRRIIFTAIDVMKLQVLIYDVDVIFHCLDPTLSDFPITEMNKFNKMLFPFRYRYKVIENIINLVIFFPEWLISFITFFCDFFSLFHCTKLCLKLPWLMTDSCTSFKWRFRMQIKSFFF